MKAGAILLIVSCLLFCPRARSQTLVYSLSYVETPASLHARFPNPFPSPRNSPENLARLRRTRKTEIRSISVADGKRALLFSDEGKALELNAAGAVSPGGKAYVVATRREESPSPARGVVAEDGVYELNLDGSNRFSKVADARPYQPRPVLNRQGTRAVFVMFLNGKYVVSIYAVPEWKLLHTWDLVRLDKTRCPGCDPISYGWLADGNRLYFELTPVGEEEANHPELGNVLCIVSQDGADLDVIPPQLGALQLPGYIRPPSPERHFLGQLPDGSDLFLDFAVPKGGPFTNPRLYLVVFNPASKLRKQFPVKFAIRGVFSPSGKYLAYIERRRTPDYRTGQHLWVKNLTSGEEKELLALPPPNPPASPEPNVSLSILGWLNGN